MKINEDKKGKDHRTDDAVKKDMNTETDPQKKKRDSTPDQQDEKANMGVSSGDLTENETLGIP